MMEMIRSSRVWTCITGALSELSQGVKQGALWHEGGFLALWAGRGGT